MNKEQLIIIISSGVLLILGIILKVCNVTLFILCFALSILIAGGWLVCYFIYWKKEKKSEIEKLKKEIEELKNERNDNGKSVENS